MLTLAMLAALTTAVPDGTRLRPSDRCYTLTRNGQPVGLERQVIRAVRIGRERVWDVVIHQLVAAMRFDLRDHFTLHRRDLTPIAFDSRKDGVEHVRLTYTPGRVTGWKTGRSGREAVDVALAGPVWEGDLWGPMFAALPLAPGRSYTLPLYQYDKGIGSFTLTVTGEERVGDAPAWTLDAGTDPARRSTYVLSTADGRTLAVRAGPFVTTPGGDCTGLG